jgi:integrase
MAGQTDPNLVFCTSEGRSWAPATSAGPSRTAIRGALQRTLTSDTEGLTPHGFVSLLSDSGVPLEEISRLVGHKTTLVTETVYRKQLRPVMQTGAVAMNDLFSAQKA